MKTKSKTDWKRLDALRDEEIDFSDIPPLGPAELSRMTLRLPLPTVAVHLREGNDGPRLTPTARAPKSVASPAPRASVTTW